MNEAEIAEYITDTFDNVHVLESNGNRFFYCGPFDLEHNKFPFTTLVTSDEYDQFSDLNRPSVCRLNVGVSKTTFRELFGDNSEEHDFTALDHIMPHPVYGKMYWVCALNPGENTWETVKTLLAEAYDADKKKQEKRGASES